MSLNLPPLNIPELLRRYGLRPDKRLGQNFLTDGRALEKVVEASGVTNQDAVLEIGPGLGSLTRLLAERAKAVTAVELDQHLIPPLREVVGDYTNIRIVQGDILAFQPDDLMEQDGYLVVANIPYYITSAVIRHLLEAKRKPQRITLTIQREVAERICARPGDLSLLAISVQVYGEPKIAAIIPAGAFYPAPQVDSAVVRVDLYAEPRVPVSLLATFFRLSKAGFSQKRKTLRNSLAGGLGWKTGPVEELLGAAEIDSKRRAETLSLDEWGRLSQLFQAKSDESAA